ncbi:MAG: DUF5320 domain-containing protein [Thermoanaerobaculales bacterium]|nr:DUF5320 domain-containing protein [Thermoanaerobaculales bacterium]
MPGRDRTGPQGQGPMTGRGLGLCRGVDEMGGANAVGRGMGWGRGMGRGFGGGGRGMGRRLGAWGAEPTSEEAIALQRKSEMLEQELAEMKQRLEKVEKS